MWPGGFGSWLILDFIDFCSTNWAAAAPNYSEIIWKWHTYRQIHAWLLCIQTSLYDTMRTVQLFFLYCLLWYYTFNHDSLNQSVTKHAWTGFFFLIYFFWWCMQVSYELCLHLSHLFLLNNSWWIDLQNVFYNQFLLTLFLHCCDGHVMAQLQL